MGQMILRHRLSPLFDLAEPRWTCNAKQVAQVSTRASQHLGLIELKHVRLQRATHECPQQDMVSRRATCKLHARKSTSKYRAAFDVWNHESKTVEGMRHVGATIGQVYGGS